MLVGVPCGGVHVTMDTMPHKCGCVMCMFVRINYLHKCGYIVTCGIATPSQPGGGDLIPPGTTCSHHNFIDGGHSLIVAHLIFFSFLFFVAILTFSGESDFTGVWILIHSHLILTCVFFMCVGIATTSSRCTCDIVSHIHVTT